MPGAERQQGDHGLRRKVPVTIVPLGIAAALLALAAQPAAADWTKVGESFASILYVDDASVRRLPSPEKGNAEHDLRQAVEMIDFKLKAPDGPSSYISTGEYDCRNRRTRYSSGQAYAGSAGTGRVLYPVTPSDWTQLSANAPNPPAFDHVCAMKLGPERPSPSVR